MPIGEILLLISFCFIIKDSKYLPQFANNIIFIPFFLWWGLGFGRLILSLPEHGMWAIRDATHLIESLFLWVGFVFAASPGAIDRLFVWWPRILMMGVLYAFTYPFSEELIPYSPTLTAAAGYTANILFTYNTSAVLILCESVRRIIGKFGEPIIPSLLIAFTVALFQARTIYLQIFAVMILLFWFRPKAFGNMGVALIVGLVSFGLINAFGIEIKGRLGESMSLDFLVRHLGAIAGVESAGVEGAARGVGQRLGWWKDIYDRLMESPANLLFGLGYGFPLVDFANPIGTPVREPHNSFISILGRIGLYGAVFFIWGHVLLVRAWYKAFNLCRQAGHKIGEERLFLLLIYIVLIWVYSFGEDAFEKPFLAIPYYFFWGVILKYRLILIESLSTINSNPRSGKVVSHAHSVAT